MSAAAGSNPLMASVADDSDANGATLAHVAARLALPVSKGLAGVSGFEVDVATSSDTAVFSEWQRGSAATFAYRLGSASMMIAVDETLTGALVERRFGGSAGPSPKSSGQCRATAALAHDVAGLIARAVADAWPGGRLADVSEITDVTRFARATDAVATVTLSCGELGEIRVAFGAEGMARMGDTPMPPRIAGWDAQIRNSVISARLPVRAVLARPVFPSATIVRLAIGDVLPIPRPATVPLYAGAHRIATGILTDNDGRTAVKIETMETLRND
ncbi:hypothetical protein BH09PSE3_BH09PSE3_09670 [soil metagenome]